MTIHGRKVIPFALILVLASVPGAFTVSDKDDHARGMLDFDEMANKKVLSSEGSLRGSSNGMRHAESASDVEDVFPESDVFKLENQSIHLSTDDIQSRLEKDGIPSVTIERIVGGEVARKNQFPYFTSVVNGGCGAILIAPKTLLSAAHCFASSPSSYKGMRVYVNARGPNRGTRRIIEEVVRHPDYSFPYWDFCLIRLDKAISIPSQPKLVLNTHSNFPSLPGESLTAIGHGFTTTNRVGGISDKTLYVTKPYVSDEECESRYFWFDSDSMVCAGGAQGEGICNGDSGGPLVKEESDGTHILVGVTSWTLQSGCALDQMPSGFAKVATVIPWIIQHACPWENDGLDICGLENDACESALTLGNVGWRYEETISGSTQISTSESLNAALVTCGISGSNSGAWYRFQAVADTTITASLCANKGGSAGYDTKVAIFESSCGSLTCKAGNDNSCGLQSEVSIEIESGKTYYILVSGSEFSRGSFELSLSTPNTPAPSQSPSPVPSHNPTPILSSVPSNIRSLLPSEIPSFVSNSPSLSGSPSKSEEPSSSSSPSSSLQPTQSHSSSVPSTSETPTS